MNIVDWRKDLDDAAHQQVQAAFHVLIQSCIQGNKDALTKFVQFVRLVEGTRQVAIKALENLPGSPV